MGALQLALFIITYLRAVNALAQTPNELQRLSIRQELALQGDTTDEYQQQQHSDSLLAKVSTANADDSPYLDTAIENSIALPLSTVGTNIQPNLIVANNAHCLPVNHPTTGANPKTRSGRQRRDTTNSKLICPLPATTTTDSENHQPPIEEKGQQEVPTPHDGSPQSEPLNWPKLFKLPTKDGDNPACFEATNGLMPVGVCENPDGQPEPSRWDVFMQDNRDFSPRAWKLPNSQLAWPGMRECVPRDRRGIWCCRFYTVLLDGSGFGDICWPLTAIEYFNEGGEGDWQQFRNPLIPGP